MEFLSFVAAWLTATPVNFVLAALVIMYLLSVLLENVRDDIYKKTEVGIICGVETACKRLAATLHRAERFELASSAEEILEQAMRRNMVILFIVGDELSGIAESVFAHLQSAYGENENKNRYQSLRYAVFGIGDTMNDDFNALAVEFDLRLRKVGAKRVVPMRLYDVVTSEDGVEREFFDFVTAFSPQSVSKCCTSTEIPENSEFEFTESSEESDNDNDSEVYDEDRIQVIEILDEEMETEEPVVETEKPVAEIEKPVVEAEKPVAETVEPVVVTNVTKVEAATAPVKTPTPQVEIVEPSVDISTSVFESVEPEVEAEKPGSDDLLAKSEASNNEAEAEVRPKSPKQAKSETEDDEGWEIIKLMSNKDDSS